jgi:hypothetical protein
MKTNNVNGFDKRKAFAPRQCDHFIESCKAEDARNRFAMGMIWLILGVACAAPGGVLFTILLK